MSSGVIPQRGKEINIVAKRMNSAARPRLQSRTAMTGFPTGGTTVDLWGRDYPVIANTWLNSQSRVRQHQWVPDRRSVKKSGEEIDDAHRSSRHSCSATMSAHVASTRYLSGESVANHHQGELCIPLIRSLCSL